MPLEDEELVLGCLKGDQKAWGSFVQRFSKLIYWSICQTIQKQPLGGVDELCEEVFQEVFRKLLEKEELSKLRDIKNLRKYLSVISCHAAMDKLKSLGRYEKKNISTEAAFFSNGEEAASPILNMTEESPAERTLSREKDALVAETLEGLSPKERACIEYHYLDGMTHRQIAAILGFSQDTVSTIIRRAKEKLRKNFTEKGLLDERK